MYSVRDHLLRYEGLKRKAANSKLLDPDDPWWIVFTFYAALHLVQAHLVFNGENPSSHSARRDAIRRDKVLPARVKTDYAFLYDLSVDVRYNPTFTPTPREVTDAEEAFDTVVRDIVPRFAPRSGRP